MPEIGLLPRDYSIAVPQIQWGLAGDIGTTPPAITPDLRAAARAHMMGAIAQGLGSGIGAYQKSKSAQDELALKKEALRIREQQIKAATAKENEPNAAEATRQALENAWTKDTPVSPVVTPAVEPELPTGGATTEVPLAADGDWHASGYASSFGGHDPVEYAHNGHYGSPRFGNVDLRDPDGVGVAVPEDILTQVLGPYKQTGKGATENNWYGAKAQVFNEDTGQMDMVPVIDVGPGPKNRSKGAVVDLLPGTAKKIGGSGWSPSKIRIIPPGQKTAQAQVDGPLNDAQIPMDDGRVINIPSESLTASTNGAGMPANVSVTPAVAPLADFSTAVAGLDQNAYNSALARSVYDENGNLVPPYKPDAPNLAAVPFQADAPVMRAPLSGMTPAVVARTAPIAPVAPLASPQFDTTPLVLRPIGNVGHDSRTGAMIYSPSPTEATAFLPGVKGKGIAKDISPPKPPTPMVREIKKADGSTVLEGFDPTTGNTVYTRPGDAPNGKEGIVFDNKEELEAKFGPGSSAGATIRSDGKLVLNKLPASAVDGDPVADSIAESIIIGLQPPSLAGLYKHGAGVRAKLAKEGYPLARAQEDWQAVQRHITTLNGPQQLRLRQAVQNAYEHLDVIEELGKEWNGGKFPLLNKARIIAAKNGALGPEAQSLAQRLDAQISDFVSEMGTVYKGGNSSTDQTLKLAAENLKADFSEKTFVDSVNQARTNLQIRLNSMKHTGAVGMSENSPYALPNTNAESPKAAESATKSASPSEAFLKQVAEVKKEYEAGAYDSDPSRKAAVEARLRKYGLIK